MQTLTNLKMRKLTNLKMRKLRLSAASYCVCMNDQTLCDLSVER